MRDAIVRRHGVWAVGVGVAIVTLFGAAFGPTTSALALGTPITVGTPGSSGAPALAVDAGGTAYIAWANTSDALPAATDVVQYCVLPTGASTCGHAGTLTPAGGVPHVLGVQVLIAGQEVVVLANVSGGSGAPAVDDEPIQEWLSSDGGQSFQIVNDGASVTNGPATPGTVTLNAVVLPGIDRLGYGWRTADGMGSFSSFPLMSAIECSQQTMCPSAQFGEVGVGGGTGGAFASSLGATPGVLGVYTTDTTKGPFACPTQLTYYPADYHQSPFTVPVEPDGIGYVFGNGTENSNGSYGASFGAPFSAWTGPARPLICNAVSPAIAAGPNGFDILYLQLGGGGYDGSGNTINIAKVTPGQGLTDAISGRNSGPQVVSGVASMTDPSLSLDGSSGIYATYLLGGSTSSVGSSGSVELLYHNGAGGEWLSQPLTQNPEGQAADLHSSVNPAGQGWAVWRDSGHVEALAFRNTDAIAPPTAVEVIPNQYWIPKGYGFTEEQNGPSIPIPYGSTGEYVAGFVNESEGTPRGSVHYRLYANRSCSATSLVFDGGSGVARARGSSGWEFTRSRAIDLMLAPGRYYWQLSYSGAPGTLSGVTGYLASLGRCGTSVLTVGPAVQINSPITRSGPPGTVEENADCLRGSCRAELSLWSLHVGRRGLLLGRGGFKFTISDAGFLDIPLNRTGLAFVARHRTAARVLLISRERLHGRTFVSVYHLRLTGRGTQPDSFNLANPVSTRSWPASRP
jgi:hypothetical protein